MIGILIGGGIAATGFVVGTYVVGTYNMLTTARQDIRTMFSDIITEYQRRADLFLNLAASAKGAMKFEKSTLTELTKARAGKLGETDKDKIKKMGDLEKTFSKLLAVVEAYPDIKSIGTVQQLMEEIRLTEDRINVSRTDYNNVVRDYNVAVTTFPSRMVARQFGFNQEIYFQAVSKNVEISPKIDIE